jgi:hypothetical protein
MVGLRKETRRAIPSSHARVDLVNNSRGAADLGSVELWFQHDMRVGQKNGLA